MSSAFWQYQLLTFKIKFNMLEKPLEISLEANKCIKTMKLVRQGNLWIDCKTFLITELAYLLQSCVNRIIHDHSCGVDGNGQKKLDLSKLQPKELESLIKAIKRVHKQFFNANLPHVAMDFCLEMALVLVNSLENELVDDEDERIEQVESSIAELQDGADAY